MQHKNLYENCKSLGTCFLRNSVSSSCQHVYSTNMIEKNVDVDE